MMMIMMMMIMMMIDDDHNNDGDDDDDDDDDDFCDHDSHWYVLVCIGLMRSTHTARHHAMCCTMGLNDNQEASCKRCHGLHLHGTMPTIYGSGTASIMPMSPVSFFTKLPTLFMMSSNFFFGAFSVCKRYSSF